MTTVGIVGGIGPESTIEYYRLILDGYRKRKGDGSAPSIIINSINLKAMLDLIAANKLSDVTEFLVAEVQRLAAAGCDFALLAANTPHVVFNEIQRRSPISLISIVEETCKVVNAMGLKRVGLFGTLFTMQGRFYPDVFGRDSIALVVPEPDDQAYIHDKYMNELVGGVFLPETRARLLSIVDRLIESDRIEALILGGTELPLILRDQTYNGIPFLDTAKIHAESAVARLV